MEAEKEERCQRLEAELKALKELKSHSDKKMLELHESFV